MLGIAATREVVASQTYPGGMGTEVLLLLVVGSLAW